MAHNDHNWVVVHCGELARLFEGERGEGRGNEEGGGGYLIYLLKGINV